MPTRRYPHRRIEINGLFCGKTWPYDLRKHKSADTQRRDPIAERASG
jgi:hypothetical protein